MPRRRFNGSTTAALGKLKIDDNALLSLLTDDNIVIDPDGTGEVISNDPFRATAGTGSTDATTGTIVTAGGITIGEDLYINGQLSATGLDGLPIGSVTPSTGTFTNLTVENVLSTTSTSEAVENYTSSSGTVVHNYANANVFRHSSMAGNITANFTNVPTTDGQTITMTVIIQQGASPYIINGVQINGSAETVYWSGYEPPVPQGNKTEIQTFTLVRANSAWTVTASFLSSGRVLDGSTQTLAASSTQDLYNAGQNTDGIYWFNFGSGAIRLFAPLQSQPGFVVVGNWNGAANAFFNNSGSMTGQNLNDSGTTTPTGNWTANSTYGYYRNIGSSGYRHATISTHGARYSQVKFRFNLYNYYSNDGFQSGRDLSGLGVGKVGDGLTLLRNRAVDGNNQHIFTYLHSIANSSYNCPNGGKFPTMRTNASSQPQSTFIGNNYCCIHRARPGYTTEYVRNFNILQGGDNAGGELPQQFPGDFFYTVDLGGNYTDDIHVAIHSDQNTSNEDTYLKRGVVLIKV